MEGLPTCANCHSFSRDGKTMGLDVDGPGNDKGLYGIVPVKAETSIRNQYVIRWSSFAEEKASKRFGFMSQISPDGQYVVTSIENPGSHMRNFDSRFFNGFYKDYGFGQVFYPTRGVLAWYSKATGKLHPRRALTTRARSRPAPFGVLTASTLFSPERRPRTNIMKARKWPKSLTIQTKRRFNTISTGFPSTTAKAARRNGLWALRRTA